MGDLFQTGKNSKLMNDHITRGTNMRTGFPRAETVYAIADNRLDLVGPPVEEHANPMHQPQYYRSNDIHRYGINGIYNFDDAAWVTQYITDVSISGTTIKFSQGVDSGDKCLILYVSRPSPYGGAYKSAIQGDQLTPEFFSTMVNLWNNAYPLRWFTNTGNANRQTYKYYLGMGYNTSISNTADIYNDLITLGTGTWVTSNTPFFITNISIKFLNATASPWPSRIDLKMSVDGTNLMGGFNPATSGYDAMTWFNLDIDEYPEDTTNYSYYPGTLYAGNEYLSTFFDTYIEETGSTNRKVFDIDVGELAVTDSFSLQMRPVGYNVNNLAVYVRGCCAP